MDIEIKRRRQPYADSTLSTRKRAKLIADIRSLEHECDVQDQIIIALTERLHRLGGDADNASAMFERIGYEVHHDIHGNPFYSEEGGATIYFRNGHCDKIRGGEFRRMTDDEIVASAQAIRKRRAL